jgi:hypothetical protein
LKKRREKNSAMQAVGRMQTPEGGCLGTVDTKLASRCEWSPRQAQAALAWGEENLSRAWSLSSPFAFFCDLQATEKSTPASTGKDNKVVELLYKRGENVSSPRKARSRPEKSEARDVKRGKAAFVGRLGCALGGNW